MCTRHVHRILVAVLVAWVAAPATGKSMAADAAAGQPRITVLYDAFGRVPGTRKDWGYAALVEVNGRRILFDTGNDPGILEANAKTLGVDLSRLDLVVMSHRHGDHMGGMDYLLKVNPRVKIYAPKENFGVFGSWLPGTFYRRDDSMPNYLRYYDGSPPERMQFGSAWPNANFELIDQTTEIAPGIHLLALVSDKPTTLELKELTLAIETPQGLVLVVGCSHAGLDKIVAAAQAINPHIHLLAGGFHLVVASDEVIAQAITLLHDTARVDYVAPGHCTGEATFAALMHAFGDHYLYAGLGTVITPVVQPHTARGAAAPRSAPAAVDATGYAML